MEQAAYVLPLTVAVLEPLTKFGTFELAPIGVEANRGGDGVVVGAGTAPAEACGGTRGSRRYPEPSKRSLLRRSQVALPLVTVFSAALVRDYRQPGRHCWQQNPARRSRWTQLLR